MVKIGLLGAGHLGCIHLKLIKEIENFELVGFYDPNPENAQKAQKEFGIASFESMDELIKKCDAIDIVTPTNKHFDCASKAIKQRKHVFIEKPLTETLKEGKTLINLAEEADVKVQVGHVERFNPAYTAAFPYICNPMFIEAHRLAQFNPRGTDVSVILDLMIHDIDIVLSIVKSNIKRISASGVAVVSDTPDIANARIEFDNGCVANLTSSRLSMKNMRKTRVFQKDAYISIDFLEKETSVIRLKDAENEPDPLAITIDLGKGKGSKQIFFESPSISTINAIKTELETFAHAIQNNISPPVTIIDGFNALDVAIQIIEKMNLTQDFIQGNAISA